MPYDEKDPEVQDVNLKLSELYGKKTAAEITLKAQYDRYRQLQETLKIGEANLNRIKGAIEAVEDIIASWKNG